MHKQFVNVLLQIEILQNEKVCDKIDIIKKDVLDVREICTKSIEFQEK